MVFNKLYVTMLRSQKSVTYDTATHYFCESGNDDEHTI